MRVCKSKGLLTDVPERRLPAFALAGTTNKQLRHGRRCRQGCLRSGKAGFSHAWAVAFDTVSYT